MLSSTELGNGNRSSMEMKPVSWMDQFSHWRKKLPTNLLPTLWVVMLFGTLLCISFAPRSGLGTEDSISNQPLSRTMCHTRNNRRRLAKCILRVDDEDINFSHYDSLVFTIQDGKEFDAKTTVQQLERADPDLTVHDNCITGITPDNIDNIREILNKASEFDTYKELESELVRMDALSSNARDYFQQLRKRVNRQQGNSTQNFVAELNTLSDEDWETIWEKTHEGLLQIEISQASLSEEDKLYCWSSMVGLAFMSKVMNHVIFEKEKGITTSSDVDKAISRQQALDKLNEYCNTDPKNEDEFQTVLKYLTDRAQIDPLLLRDRVMSPPDSEKRRREIKIINENRARWISDHEEIYNLVKNYEPGLTLQKFVVKE